MSLDYLKDSVFLKKLDLENLKRYYVKIIVLAMDESPLQEIQGKITSGSINIDGNSSIRRTCNLTFLVDKTEDNNLMNINNLLSINKKIKIMVGIENIIDDKYDNIIWFNQGIFIINQPNITHSNQGITVSLSCKDKMCLLNGECGGTLPASTIFHEYDQLDENGTPTSIKQLIYDIVRTLVIFYGGEAVHKVIINDIPLKNKQITTWTSTNTLYYDASSQKYTTTVPEREDVDTFQYNDEIGYVYQDFIYPGELISNFGDNVCTILDKIKSMLGNFEYFYDVDGNFIFQEVKNYLNKSYSAVGHYRLNDPTRTEVNGLNILDNNNYYVDFSGEQKNIYTFDENNKLITSYSNAPSYINIKNDFHIWGKNKDAAAIHYHLAIKTKPIIPEEPRKVVFLKNDDGTYNGRLRLAKNNDKDEDIEDYIAKDWRAEMYLQGLEKLQKSQRPDIYEQELLDFFDMIYDFKEQQFKTKMVDKPNDLNYFLDFLEPYDELNDCAVDSICMKTYTYQQDHINKLYNKDVPDLIVVNEDDENYAELIQQYKEEEQPYVTMSKDDYANITTATTGYSAEETMRELLYQYTEYNASINFQAIPIYYLDANRRISIYDKDSNIYGDYIIKSISLPLDPRSTMTITATKALQRI